MPVARIENDFDTIEKVYCLVCENPGKPTEHISKELDIPEEKINNALEELERNGLIEAKFARTSPIVKKNYPVEKSILMTSKFKRELKKFLQENLD